MGYKDITWASLPKAYNFSWHTTVKGVAVHATEPISDDEASAYISMAKERFAGVRGIYITVDGEYVDFTVDLVHHGFERIRRITGYLVGTLDRFNDAKRAEESERVKHNLGGCC